MVKAKPVMGYKAIISNTAFDIAEIEKILKYSIAAKVEIASTTSKIALILRVVSRLIYMTA
ncbi:hypothetical protein D3C80_2174820 [compost metagenome]